MNEEREYTKHSASDLSALTTEQFLQLVGSRVRAQRLKVSMSRKLLAQESGVSERYLAQLESGQGNISIGLLRNVAAAIGMSLSNIMSEKDVHPVPQREPVA